MNNKVVILLAFIMTLAFGVWWQWRIWGDDIRGIIGWIKGEKHGN